MTAEHHERPVTSLQFIPVKTRPFLPPRDSIYSLLDDHLPPLEDGDILVITSKVLAIHQGRCVKISPDVDRLALAARESDRYITVEDYYILAVRDHTLLPNAGLDESNGNGHYILMPKNVAPLLSRIRRRLKNKNGIERLGLITTDSHTIPLRAGVLGISVGFCGIEPLKDYRGKPDIFGRLIAFSRANVVDALAAMSVLIMGEGSESQPLLIIRGADFVSFTDKPAYEKLILQEHEDLYSPLLKIMNRPTE